ncbi:chemotaxis protein CheX [Eubacteriaceae bacterium ES2]|nr:chemotaxis protein CheX [Eubacteriaceae bacterium ES2]
MDVKLLNPFIEAVNAVLPQLGFQNIETKTVTQKTGKLAFHGVVLTLGIVGDKKGNVVYSIDLEGAKNIASIMMMGMPVEEFDDMAQSALSELSNMLTANATINFSNEGITVDISVPTLMHGERIELSLNKEEILEVTFDIDGVNLSINLAMD